MKTTGSKLSLRLTLVQRKAVAELLPSLADRLLLDAAKQHAITHKAGDAITSQHASPVFHSPS